MRPLDARVAAAGALVGMLVGMLVVGAGASWTAVELSALAGAVVACALAEVVGIWRG